MELYERNLATLHTRQPDVASWVEGAVVGGDVRPVTARDGSRTFLINHSTQRPLWFGGSSMPTISCVELFSAFHGDGSSVALPGILTGGEPAVLLGKLPNHAALFVVEQSASNLKLALHLHDYTAWVDAGRLIFIPSPGDALIRNLCRFFEHNVGYLPPRQLVTVPQQSPGEIAELQRTLEDAGRAVTDLQARAVASALSVMKRRSFTEIPRTPRVAIISADCSPEALAQAQRVGRALADLAWPCGVCVPDSPARCHVAARLRAINAVNADLALIINGTAAILHPSVPRTLPIACWFLSAANVREFAPWQWSCCQRLFAATQQVYQALVRAGAPAERVEHGAMAADQRMCRSDGAKDGRNADGRFGVVEVAVLADLPDDRAEAVGIGLAGHITLWNALRDAAVADIEGCVEAAAGRCLDVAVGKSGVTLKDEALRDDFLRLFRERIAPAVRARKSAASLANGGLLPGLWGRNWAWPKEDAPADNGWARLVRGHIPTDEALARLLRRARVVVLPLATPEAVQIGLDALASGTPIVLHGHRAGFESAFPGLADLAGDLVFFDTPAEVVRSVRRLRSGDRSSLDRHQRVRNAVMQDHTTMQRLSELIRRMRSCLGACTPVQSAAANDSPARG